MHRNITMIDSGNYRLQCLVNSGGAGHHLSLVAFTQYCHCMHRRLVVMYILQVYGYTLPPPLKLTQAGTSIKLIDRLGFNGTFSPNRLHLVFEKYLAVKQK